MSDKQETSVSSRVQSTRDQQSIETVGSDQGNGSVNSTYFYSDSGFDQNLETVDRVRGLAPELDRTVGVDHETSSESSPIPESNYPSTEFVNISDSDSIQSIGETPPLEFSGAGINSISKSDTNPKNTQTIVLFNPLSIPIPIPVTNNKDESSEEEDCAVNAPKNETSKLPVELVTGASSGDQTERLSVDQSISFVLSNSTEDDHYSTEEDEEEAEEDKSETGDINDNENLKSVHENSVSESVLFLQKLPLSQQKMEDPDGTSMPILPPGICNSSVSETSDDTSLTTTRRSSSSNHSLDALFAPQQDTEVDFKEAEGLDKSLVKPKKQIWNFNQRVIRHCSLMALKFKIGSVIPKDVLNNIIEICHASQNFPKIKSQIKKLRLKVFQIARSVRQVLIQSNAIVEILGSFEGAEELIYGYHCLAQTVVKNCKGRNDDGIFSVALVVRNISRKHPLLLRLVLSALHEISPLTVPMNWSYDEESPEARLEYQKLMGYTLVSDNDDNDDDDSETIESESCYLKTHKSLVQLYAALLVAAPKEEAFGVEAGWQYLSRFLNTLPPSRTTATALYSFLEFTGNRLYSAYGRQFEKILIFVKKRFVSEMKQEDGDEASAISRLNTFITLQQYRDTPRYLEMPLDEESRSSRVLVRFVRARRELWKKCFISNSFLIDLTLLATADETQRTEALTEAKQQVLEIWRNLTQQQQHRGTRFQLPSKPRVIYIDGKLSIKIPISNDSDLTALIVQITHSLSKQNKDSPYVIKDGEIKIKVAECGVARILQFEPLTNDHKWPISVQIFIPTFGQDSPEIELIKDGSLTSTDLILIESLMRLAVQKRVREFPKKHEGFLQDFDEHMDWSLDRIEDEIQQFFKNSTLGHTPDHTLPDSGRSLDSDQLIKKLEGMGAVVYVPNPTNKVDWGVLAGYDSQKRCIEDGLLLPLLHPEVFDSIAKKTRKHFSSNRPRGVLFEGPPGTGKTTSARIIAAQAAVPLVYIPLESVLSKFYGESERLLAEVFTFADRLGGSIVFFDEIESLATTRSAEMHEATRRVLGVLLREMDGFDTRKKIVVIGATNRKQDLDPALISRFDATIEFGLPDVKCRAKIIEQYAQHLTEKEILQLADLTTRLSGRDIRDICEAAERSWASKIIRGEVESAKLPGIQEYLTATKQRHSNMTPSVTNS
eukprot:g2783.t1